MKNQAIEPMVDRTKTAPIAFLFITALLIIISGTAFSVYSVVNNISFTVMNAQIHGAIWGLVIIFLGARYLLSVRRLKAEVYKSTSVFSWSNFKKEKTRKTR